MVVNAGMSTGMVLGGGIAGLAFAAAMNRHGHQITVLEAAPTLRAHGSGLVLGPTAMLALSRLGLRDQAIAAGQVLSRGGLADLAMRPLSKDVFGHFGERSGEPFIGIERSVLVRMLAEAAPECRTDARYVSLEYQGDEVLVELKSGERLRAPWVVLADGIRSVGREHIGSAKVRDAGQWCWRGIAEGVDLGEHDNAFLEAWGSEWRYGFTPVGGGRTYWFVTRCDLGAHRPAGCARADRRALLLEAAERFPALITRLIEATRSEEVLENRLEDLAPLPRWHQGNLLCIGDAAHAMTPNLGQGATQSLEDGVILAGMVVAGGKPADAFARFEATRRRRAERTVREARTLGRIAHCPGWAAPARDAVMRLLPRALSVRQLAWLYEDRALVAALS